MAARLASVAWMWPSIRLKDAPTRPASVPGSVSGTPAGSSTSPDSSGRSATCAAVEATRSSGRSDHVTSKVPSTPASSSTTPDTKRLVIATVLRSWFIAVIGSPVIRMSPWVPRTAASR